MNIEDVKLAYVVSSSTSKGYIGAVLITDYKGYPIEFQYTDPILPTKIQQILYGQGLEKYIKVDVILDSPLKVISSKIDILVVQDEDMLNYKSSKADIIRISQAKKTQIEEGQEITKLKSNDYIIQCASAGSALRIQFANPVNETDEKFISIFELIKEASTFIDVYEPIDRVYKSIELITNQEV